MAKKKFNETQKHTSGCGESGMGWLGTSDEGSRCGLSSELVDGSVSSSVPSVRFSLSSFGSTS